MIRTWPDNWEARQRGDACPLCADLSTRSFHSGRTSEALLERHAIANGHAAVVFRGRHVASFTDLTAGELADYWTDVQHVGRLIERVFNPCHVNYLVLGNIVPHLHVHVVPRYLDDPSPERPLPWDPREVPAEEYARQVLHLQEAAIGRPERGAVSVATLRAITEAFNAHDLDAIMAFFSDDCVLDMPRGPDPWGTRFTGKAAVREGLAARFTGLPDVQYGDDRHWLSGNLGVSEWLLTGTTPQGVRIHVRGCDHWEFRDGFVVRKDSYWKIVDTP